MELKPLSTKEKQRVEKMYGQNFTDVQKFVDGEITFYIVECPEHGQFKIRPDNFLNKRGCIDCPVGSPRRSPPSAPVRNLSRYAIDVVELNTDHLSVVLYKLGTTEMAKLPPGLVARLIDLRGKEARAIMLLINSMFDSLDSGGTMFDISHKKKIIEFIDSIKITR